LTEVQFLLFLAPPRRALARHTNRRLHADPQIAVSEGWLEGSGTSENRSPLWYQRLLCLANLECGWASTVDMLYHDISLTDLTTDYDSWDLDCGVLLY